MRNLNAALVEAYAIAPVATSVIDTLEVALEGQPSIYCTNSYSSFSGQVEDSTTKVFIPTPFSVTLPRNDANGLPTMVITIDNVDHKVSDFIKLANTIQKPVMLKYRPYVSTSPAPTIAPPMTFYVASAQITATQVSIQASFPDIVNKPFPRELYTLKLFPGLYG